MNVLVVDDEPRVLDALQALLQAEGHDVTAVPDGSAALAAIAREEFDAVVLDVSMPGLSGLDVTATLRRFGDRVPILMLTARAAVQDRVDGLDAGADDYLTKPFDPAEFTARVRALLRRNAPLDTTTLAYDDLVFDPVQRLAHRAGRAVPCTATEAGILEVLMLHPEQVMTRSIINEHVWGSDFGPRSNSLTVYIGYLRRKLEAGGERRLIHTVQGLGYRLGDPA